VVTLILGSEQDHHAVYVLDVLRGRGADAELVDSRWFPRQMQLSFDPQQGRGSLVLPHRRRIDLSAVRSVYWRSYHGIEPVQIPDPEQAYIATNDARSLFESLLIRLPTRWVNGWEAYQSHQTKPAQLAAVSSLGIRVPETLLTNDPDEVREFAARHPRCIFKPVQGGAHTRPVTPAHLTDENLANLAYAPVTLQEEISGTNLRVFVVGERVLTCEVRTGALDFREDPEPVIVPFDLPPAIQQQCLRAARTLHLVWSGIDLRLTPEGEYYFLEANPSPMFLGFESRCGLPITEALVELLLREE